MVYPYGSSAPIYFSLSGPDGVAHAFSHLRRLSIHFSPEHGYIRAALGHRVSPKTEEDPEHLERFMSQVNNLKELHLSADADPYDLSCHSEIFPTLARGTLHKAIVPNLKRLCLDGHEIMKDVLLKFIYERRSTLESLALWQIQDGWKEHPTIEDDIHNAVGRDDLDLRMMDVYNGDEYSEWRPAELPGIDGLCYTPSIQLLDDSNQDCGSD